AGVVPAAARAGRVTGEGVWPVRALTATVPCRLPGRSRGFAGSSRQAGVSALISWLVTALFGLYLLAVWLIENDVTHRGAAASRLPAPVIVGHVLLAL